jgi:hypothetical protein
MATNKLSGKGGPGGGMGSRAVGKPTQYFTGRPSQRVAPGGVSQFGEAVGNHITDRGATNYRGDPVRMGSLPGPGSTQLGNAKALDVGKGGPGAGRVVLRSGGQHGLASPAPIGPTKDTLAEYGPDSPNAAGRRR